MLSIPLLAKKNRNLMLRSPMPPLGQKIQSLDVKVENWVFMSKILHFGRKFEDGVFKSKTPHLGEKIFKWGV